MAALFGQHERHDSPPHRRRYAIDAGVARQLPSLKQHRYVRTQKAHNRFGHNEVTGPHASGMQRLMLLLDFSTTVPPQADHIDELCIVRKQSAKALHIMTIPVIDERRPDRLDGLGFGISIH